MRLKKNKIKHIDFFWHCFGNTQHVWLIIFMVSLCRRVFPFGIFFCNHFNNQIFMYGEKVSPLEEIGMEKRSNELIMPQFATNIALLFNYSTKV